MNHNKSRKAEILGLLCSSFCVTGSSGYDYSQLVSMEPDQALGEINNRLEFLKRERRDKLSKSAKIEKSLLDCLSCLFLLVRERKSIPELKILHFTNKKDIYKVIKKWRKKAEKRLQER